MWAELAVLGQISFQGKLWQIWLFFKKEFNGFFFIRSCKWRLQREACAWSFQTLIFELQLNFNVQRQRWTNKYLPNGIRRNGGAFYQSHLAAVICIAARWCVGRSALKHHTILWNMISNVSTSQAVVSQTETLGRHKVQHLHNHTESCVWWLSAYSLDF